MAVSAPTAPTLAGEIQEQGCSLTSCRQFFSDASLAWQVVSLGHQHAVSDAAQQAERDFAAGVKRDVKFKQFVCKLQERQRLKADHPLLLCGQRPEFLELYRDVMGREGRLYSADLWYIVKNASLRPREWSHNWHRDPEDGDTLKAFLFCADVDASAGPLEYVAGSHRDLFELCAPGHYGSQEIDRRIPAHRRREFTCRAGDILIANTSGIHRGGYTCGRPRVSAVWTYVPADCPRPNLYEVIE